MVIVGSGQHYGFPRDQLRPDILIPAQQVCVGITFFSGQCHEINSCSCLVYAAIRLLLQGNPHSAVGVHHPQDDGGHLRPGDIGIGTEHPGGVVAHEDPGAVELIDGGIGAVHIGNRPVGDAVHFGEGGFRQGTGQYGGEFLPGQLGVHVLGNGGDDFLADGVVGVGLIPGVGGGEAAAAAEVEFAQPGGNDDGLGGGDLPAGLELLGLDAVHEAVAVGPGDAVSVPGVGGHVAEVVVVGDGFFEPHPAVVPAGGEGVPVLAEVGGPIGGQFPVLGEPAQEGGFALGGGGQVVLPRTGHQLGGF